MWWWTEFHLIFFSCRKKLIAWQTLSLKSWLSSMQESIFLAISKFSMIRIRTSACLSSSWSVSEQSSIRVLKSCWESQFTKCVQISKKSILFDEIQTSKKRWIFDKANWSCLCIIFLLAIHELWIFLLISEWDEMISWLIAEFIILRSAWSSDHSTAQKSRFHRIINETRVSLIIFLFKIFLKISFSNSFCCISSLLWISWSCLSLMSLTWWSSDSSSISWYLRRWYQAEIVLRPLHERFLQYLQ